MWILKYLNISKKHYQEKSNFEEKKYENKGQKKKISFWSSNLIRIINEIS